MSGDALSQSIRTAVKRVQEEEQRIDKRKRIKRKRSILYRLMKYLT